MLGETKNASVVFSARLGYCCACDYVHRERVASLVSRRLNEYSLRIDMYVYPFVDNVFVFY